MTNQQNKHLFIPLTLELFPYMDMIFLIKKHGKIVNASLEFSAGYVPAIVTFHIKFGEYGVIAKYYAVKDGIQVYDMRVIPEVEIGLEHNVDELLNYIAVCIGGLERCKAISM